MCPRRRASPKPRAERHSLPLRVAYHDACHLAHAQQIRTQPRALLESIPRLELLSPRNGSCAAAGRVYNLLEPEAAADLGRRKAANLMGTGPDAIAAANPGCVIQIAQHLERPIAVLHPMQLLARSLRGER